jgi:hypothetical protein
MGVPAKAIIFIYYFEMKYFHFEKLGGGDASTCGYL